MDIEKIKDRFIPMSETMFYILFALQKERHGVGNMASCFIWRKEYTDICPESFTDKESTIKRNKRVRNAVIAAFVLVLTQITVDFFFIQRKEKIMQIIILSFIAVYLLWVIKKIQYHIDT